MIVKYSNSKYSKKYVILDAAHEIIFLMDMPSGANVFLGLSTEQRIR